MWPRTTCRSRSARSPASELLQRRYAGQLDERADRYIEFAVDGANRMQTLISDLLQFSRVGRGTTPIARSIWNGSSRGARLLSIAIEESGAEIDP